MLFMTVCILMSLSHTPEAFNASCRILLCKIYEVLMDVKFCVQVIIQHDFLWIYLWMFMSLDDLNFFHVHVA